MSPARSRHRLAALLVRVGLAATGAAAQAQTGQTISIPDTPACPDCRIAHRVLATLSSASVEGEIEATPFTVRADPRGNFWVVAEARPPRVYGPDGRFMRSLGRMGGGPGEFQMVDDLFWPTADTLVVFDGATRLASVFADGSTFVRQLRLQQQAWQPFARAWPSQVLVTGDFETSPSTARPLHVLDLSGAEARVRQSFGTATPRRRFGNPRHHFAESAAGLLVSAAETPFALHRWRANGSLHSTLRRTAGWFPDTASGRIGTPASPPSPAVRGVEVADDGLIWVFVRVPARTWRDGWPELPPGAREVALRQLDYGRLFDTRIEVIDPLRRRLLTSETLPGYAISSLGDGRLALYSADAVGLPMLRVLQLRLERGNER